MKQNPMLLRYDAPAPIMDDFLHYSTYENAWERYSLPLGNGFFGIDADLGIALFSGFVKSIHGGKFLSFHIKIKIRRA